MTVENLYFRMDENHNLVPCKNIEEYLEWAGGDKPSKPIRQTRIFKGKPNEILISTIFIFINHNWSNNGPPICFETMVFCENGPEELHNWQNRYRSYKEALEGHREAVRLVTSILRVTRRSKKS